jgi:T3SS negative regulator,GrlR
MNPGIYHVHFKGGPSQNFGDGMAVFKDGTINGADPGYTYRGSYEIKDNKFLAKIAIKRWNPGVTNPTLNLAEYDLSVDVPVPGDWAKFSVAARVVQFPQIPPISINGTRLVDAV